MSTPTKEQMAWAAKWCICRRWEKSPDRDGKCRIEATRDVPCLLDGRSDCPMLAEMPGIAYTIAEPLADRVARWTEAIDNYSALAARVEALEKQAHGHVRRNKALSLEVYGATPPGEFPVNDTSGAQP